MLSKRINMLSIINLSKSFGRNHVLRDINLDFTEPGVYAILGPNGSGKTTMIKSILGMVVPNRGDIKIDGEGVIGKWLYRKRIAYLPQIARFPENLTVNELFKMVMDLREDCSLDNDLIENFGITPFLTQKLSNLSGGTRQKVNLLITFQDDCPILILDEPTAGLDPVSIVKLKAFIKRESQRGKIILITTHVMSLVEDLADEIIFLLEGDIHFRGTTSQLLTTYKGGNVEEAIATLLENERNQLRASSNGKASKNEKFTNELSKSDIQL